MKRDHIKFGLMASLLFFCQIALAQKEIFSKSEQAIQGYDPVAYFKESKPVKGNSAYVYRWKDVQWFFANEKNLNDFKANPEKFAPQYGGYCAYGMAGGYKAPTSADAWSIVDGRLYLNYDRKVQNLWKEDQAGFINKANSNWPTVRKSKE
jgi:YHS domain-containing protein